MAEREVAAGLVPFQIPGATVKIAASRRTAEDYGVSTLSHPSFVLDTTEALSDLLTSFESLALSSPRPLDFLAEAADSGSLESLSGPVWTSWPAYVEAQSLSRAVSSPISSQTELGAALKAVSVAWRAVANPDDLGVIVSIRSSNSARPLELQSNRGALLIYPGSLRFELARSFTKLVAFAVALVRRQGMPSIQADSIRARLRLTASRRPGVEPLQPIEDVETAALAGKSGVVVFIHGLISTDLGLFDSLIRRLRHSAPDAQLVGFSHDTFTHIMANQQVLVNWCRATVGKPPPDSTRLPLVLVAHSRGGLVARAAAATLFGGRDGASWREQIRGCVTFGTPHAGAALAESPESLVPLLAMMSVAAGVRDVWSVADILTYYGAGGQFPGVADLKPQSQQPADGFFATLSQMESTHGRVDLQAFGGSRAVDKRVARFVGRALGDQPHDHVVEQASTLAKPLFLPTTAQVAMTSDHFSYFADVPANIPHLTRAVAYIATRVGGRDDVAKLA